MARTCAFYATAADLRPILAHLEEAMAVEYLCLPDICSEQVLCFGSARDIPDFMVTPTGGIKRQFAIVRKGARPEPVGQMHVSGRMRYRLTPREVGTGLCLDEAGLHGDDTLLPSRIYTVGQDPEFLRLFQRVDRRIRRGFARVRGWPVGPEALALLDAGGRLTAFVAAPRDNDLRRD